MHGRMRSLLLVVLLIVGSHTIFAVAFPSGSPAADAAPLPAPKDLTRGNDASTSSGATDANSSIELASRASDVIIGLAYFAIPCQIFYFQRLLSKNFPFTWVIWLFEAFITWCGITHFIHIFPYFPPWTLMAAKVITAIVSVVTSLLLVRLMPRALSIPVKLVVLEEELGLRIQNEQNLIIQNDALQKFRQVTHNIRRTLHFRSICDISCSKITDSFDQVDGTFVYFANAHSDVLQRLSGPPSDAGDTVFSPTILSSTAGPGSCRFECVSEYTIWNLLRRGSSTSSATHTTRSTATAPYLCPNIVWDENVRVLSKVFSVPVYRNNDANFSSLSHNTRTDSPQDASTSVAMLGNVDLACLLGVNRFQSGLAVPLIVGDRTGFILICSKADDAFARVPTDLALLCDLSSQVQIALNQAHQIEIEKLRLEQIGEQAKTNALLAKEKEEAQATTKMKTEFLATISHELRTPLNAIIGFVDLILTQQGLTKDNREVLEMVASSSTTLLTLVNNILDLSKLEFHGAQMQLEQAPFSIRECAEHAVDLLHPATEAKGIRLNYFIDDAIPDILLGDKTRLQQILANLLSNAIKFTEKGEVYLCASRTELPRNASCSYYQSVATSSAQQQKCLNFEQPSDSGRASSERQRSALSDDWRVMSTQTPETTTGQTAVARARQNSFADEAPGESQPTMTIYFQVVDTGVGISDENLQLLFEKFRQVDSRFSRRYQGTGLGLAITAKLVELYRGKIWVQSKYNVGSVFSFTLNLPLAPDTPVPPSLPSFINSATGAAESSISRCLTTPLATPLIHPRNPDAPLVMLIESYLTARASTALLLLTCGYSFIAFENITAATEYLAACENDLSTAAANAVVPVQGRRQTRRKPALVLVDEQTLSDDIDASMSASFSDRPISANTPFPSTDVIASVQALLQQADLPIVTVLRPIRIRMPAANSAISSGGPRYTTSSSQLVTPRTLPPAFYNVTISKPLKRRMLSETLQSVLNLDPAPFLPLHTTDMPPQPSIVAAAAAVAPAAATPGHHGVPPKTPPSAGRTRHVSAPGAIDKSPASPHKFVRTVSSGTRAGAVSPSAHTRSQFASLFSPRTDHSRQQHMVELATGNGVIAAPLVAPNASTSNTTVLEPSAVVSVPGANGAPSLSMSDALFGPPSGNDSESRLSNLDVLVVDDNPINCSVAVKMLNYIGVRSVMTANDGLAGFHAIQQHAFPFVFMDVSMPIMDGLEATAKIHKEISATLNPYICAMTASALPEERIMCLEHGMNDFVSKPIKRQELRDVFDRYFASDFCHRQLKLRHAQQQQKQLPSSPQPAVAPAESA
ncbi:Histidine kinase osmosensor [Sorochytrium milnesiophthora]